MGRHYSYVSITRDYVLLLCVSFALSSCLVVPTPEHGLSSGRGKITQSEWATVEDGVTTREQVLLRFGEPSVRRFDDEMFIYEWTVKTAYVYFGGGYGPGQELPIRKQYQATLVFDENGILERHDLTWDSFNQAAGHEFSDDLLEVPDGKSAIFFYRRWSPVDLFSAFPVSVDASSASLQNGGFAVIILDPGSHKIYGSDKPLVVKTASNEKVFVQMKIGWRFGYSAVKLEVVPEERALRQIRKTDASM